jgi:hypothetical protein
VLCVDDFIDGSPEGGSLNIQEAIIEKAAVTAWEWGQQK